MDIAQWLKFFRTTGYFNFGYLQGETGRGTSGSSLLHKNSNPSDFFFFFFAMVQPLVRNSAKADNTWGSKSPKTSQNGLFHECWIGMQNIYNLTISNESVNQKPLRIRKLVVWLNFEEFLDYTKNFKKFTWFI